MSAEPTVAMSQPSFVKLVQVAADDHMVVEVFGYEGERALGILTVEPHRDYIGYTIRHRYTKRTILSGNLAFIERVRVIETRADRTRMQSQSRRKRQAVS